MLSWAEFSTLVDSIPPKPKPKQIGQKKFLCQINNRVENEILSQKQTFDLLTKDIFSPNDYKRHK